MGTACRRPPLSARQVEARDGRNPSEPPFWRSAFFDAYHVRTVHRAGTDRSISEPPDDANSTRTMKLERFCHQLVDQLREARRVLELAAQHDGPTLVDVISQPLQDAQAPVSEWIA